MESKEVYHICSRCVKDGAARFEMVES